MLSINNRTSYFRPMNDGVRKLTHSAYKVFMQMNQEGSNKAFHLRGLPFLPIFVALPLMIYALGGQSNDPKQAQNNLLRILLESGLTYAIIDKTSGIFPLVGLILCAFRAGQKPDMMQKVQAVTSTVTTLGMGYMGVQAVAGLTEAAAEKEELDIRKLINKPEVKKYISELLQHPNEAEKQLGSILKELSDNFDRQDQVLSSTKKLTEVNWEDVKPIRQAIDTGRADLAQQFRALGDGIFDGVEEKISSPFRELRQSVLSAQRDWVKWCRRINPMFGYMIMAFIAAPLLSKELNKYIEKYLSFLKNIKTDPLWKNPDTPLLARFLGGQSSSAVQNNSGVTQPTLLMPGVGNGVLQ